MMVVMLVVMQAEIVVMMVVVAMKVVMMVLVLVVMKVVMVVVMEVVMVDTWIYILVRNTCKCTCVHRRLKAYICQLNLTRATLVSLCF